MNKLPTMEERIEGIEKRVITLEIKYEGIDKRLTNIEGGINRVQWILISAIILSILGLIIKQGIQL